MRKTFMETVLTCHCPFEGIELCEKAFNFLTPAIPPQGDHLALLCDSDCAGVAQLSQSVG